jgi:hypothetical protein
VFQYGHAALQVNVLFLMTDFSTKRCNLQRQQKEERLRLKKQQKQIRKQMQSEVAAAHAQVSSAAGPCGIKKVKKAKPSGSERKKRRLLREQQQQQQEEQQKRQDNEELQPLQQEAPKLGANSNPLLPSLSRQLEAPAFKRHAATSTAVLGIGTSPRTVCAHAAAVAL